MTAPELYKPRTINVATCPDVQAHLRAFQPARAAVPAPTVKSSALMVDTAKRKALSLIGHVETVAHMGAIKLTGGIALYLAHIRQVERQAGTTPGRQPARRRDAIGREV
jgi:hypothetical protein